MSSMVTVTNAEVLALIVAAVSTPAAADVTEMIETQLLDSHGSFAARAWLNTESSTISNASDISHAIAEALNTLIYYGPDPEERAPIAATENIARAIVKSLNSDSLKNRRTPPQIRNGLYPGGSHGNIVDAIDDVATALHAIANAIEDKS